MVVNGRPLKRMKRRVTADVNDFFTFPSGESPVDGPFRNSVKAFVSKYALLPPPSSLLPQLMTRQIVFRVGDSAESNSDGDDLATVCLDVVEENVARSRSVYCDQCRVVGWSGNPVCAKRYHFIIKADGSSIGGYNKPCSSCGDSFPGSDLRCKSCSHEMTAEDAEDWMYNQLEDTTHLLHAVVHTNGYGHLLRVNGREGGSRVLSGCHIMDFWDRLCKVLAVRKVSVMDVSKKYGLEFRLLHAITKGHPWYGDWGYEFGAGSFGLTVDAYNMAVETLSNTPLSIFTSQGRKPRTRLQDLISIYQSISEDELVNIRDLFCFLMNLIRAAHTSPVRVDDATFKKRKLCDSRILSAWTDNDIFRVEKAMFKVMRAISGSSWVPWRALRGAVCKAGPPELLDYCLKELKGKHAANGMVVNSRCNPESGALEYRLERVSVSENESSNSICHYPSGTNHPAESNLLHDLRYLYEAMLHPLTMLSFVPEIKLSRSIESARKLLDCKQFVKNYHPEKFFTVMHPSAVQLSCEVDLVDLAEDDAIKPPPEVIILPCIATISDVKIEGAKAFQEVYLSLRRFQAEEIIGYGGVPESTQVKLLFGSTETVRIRGKCQGKNGSSKFRMERGVESWIVDCICGARDDDGERMLACDVCGVWQHTRCSGIPDHEAVPAKYVCRVCSDRATKAKGDMVDLAYGSANGKIRVNWTTKA
ncbi:hypothetical protein DCAR_0417889 [Daucus carota subsp. sativus]|uniref:Uncharacterized protein n=1 Tax=Daucus carota subsp. sativus TaxID=79200 RepID=A0A165Z042_DAUCS|nr:PREDICTED: PHD finger protein At1g33420 isoform X3 [Daucus carota subsp. sativus]WOG98545.1 hypothetical protein DCAR_0417889 [Daucus carota subsp. sativus]